MPSAADHRPTPEAILALAELFHGGDVCVLTGAGCSTESGIPDYRGEGTRRRARNPIQFREFIQSAEARQRYWARSMIGWPRFREARPNSGHRCIAELEDQGKVCGVITQNVDGLHGRAGSRAVVELHGNLDRAHCVECKTAVPRDQLQLQLEALNPELAGAHGELAPDGDAALVGPALCGFRHPVCEVCGGTLKPSVVFFGETVPPSVVAEAQRMVEQCKALVVLGSSMVVFSGYRFVRRAAARSIPIGIVNLDETRADSLAAVRVEAPIGRTLTALMARLPASTSPT